MATGGNTALDPFPRVLRNSRGRGPSRSGTAQSPPPRTVLNSTADLTGPKDPCRSAPPSSWSQAGNTIPAALQEAQQHLKSSWQTSETPFPPHSPPPEVGTSHNQPGDFPLPAVHPQPGQDSDFFQEVPDSRLSADRSGDLQGEGETVYALQDARTFPSDTPPPGFGPVRLEQNDVAVLLRSDSLANITSATNALFGSGSNQAGSLFKVTSVRQGFAGGGFYGQQGLPSKLALAAGIPGAASIPRQSPLFLGFTSTLVSNMGPDVIANLETLPGLTDQWPNGYFKQGRPCISRTCTKT